MYSVISCVIYLVISSIISFCHDFCIFSFIYFVITFGIYLLLELETFLYFLSFYHILKNIQIKPPIFLLITIEYDLILTALNL